MLACEEAIEKEVEVRDNNETEGERFFRTYPNWQDERTKDDMERSEQAYLEGKRHHEETSEKNDETEDVERFQNEELTRVIKERLRAFRYEMNVEGEERK